MIYSHTQARVADSLCTLYLHLYLFWIVQAPFGCLLQMYHENFCTVSIARASQLPLSLCQYILQLSFCWSNMFYNGFILLWNICNKQFLYSAPALPPTNSNLFLHTTMDACWKIKSTSRLHFPCILSCLKIP